MPLRLPTTNVAIRPFDESDFYNEALGIIKPQTNKKRLSQGMVKFVGPDCNYVRPGDHVIFGGYSGTLVYIDGEGRLIILKEEFIPCVIEDEDITVSGLFYEVSAKDKMYTQVVLSEALELIYAAVNENNSVRALEFTEVLPRTQQKDS